MINELLNLIECSREFGLPIKWLKENAKRGEIPCLKIGGRKLLFNRTAVNKALAEMAAKGKRSIEPGKQGGNQ